MNKKKAITAGLLSLLLAVVVGLFVFGQNTASATGNTDDCVPKDAWTEVIEHPEVSHEETNIVVDEEAWTEVTEGTPDLWWNWSPNDTHGAQDYEPAFLVDERGTWQGPHANGGPMQDTYGTFNSSHGGSGNSSWFHREQGVAEQVIEHPAVTHEVTVVVVDEAAWTEVIEHPAVVCEVDEHPEQPEPLVGQSSTIEYECGDDFETTTLITTTTEYVLVDDEWVLSEPVVETEITETTVKVVSCSEEPPVDNPEEPNTPVVPPADNPEDPNTPAVPADNPPVQPVQPSAPGVPTSVNAGM